MKEPDAASTERRARRASWPLRKRTLGENGDDDAKAQTPTERLGAMWELAVAAWLVSGRQLPEYAREDAPVKAVPLTES